MFMQVAAALMRVPRYVLLFEPTDEERVEVLKAFGEPYEVVYPAQICIDRTNDWLFRYSGFRRSCECAPLRAKTLMELAKAMHI